MRFEALLDRHARGELSQIEAAEMLGVSERTFRRWRDRLRDEGPDGLADRRIGKASRRRAAEDEILRMLGLYREHYVNFTVKHFHEQLVKRHHYRLGYTVTKLHLHRSGLVKPAPRRSAHRKKRPRRPMLRMLLHQERLAARLARRRPAARPGGHPRRRHLRDLFGVPGRGGRHRLELPRAGRGGGGERLVLRPLHRPGQPLFPYADGGRHGVADAADPGRPGACAARHRAHRCLLAGGARPLRAGLPDAAGPAAEGAQAGRYHRHRRRQPLAGRSLSARARTPASPLPAEQDGSAFIADVAQAWREILCVQDDRQVGNDNTVKWKRLSLQIPPSPLRPHFVRTKVRVHEYPDGRLAVFWGPHRLADYDPQGTIIDARALAARAASAASPAVDLWISLPRSPQPHQPQPPQKRSIHALRKPVNLTRSLQRPCSRR